MITVQSDFVILVITLLIYLVVDGLLSGSVWVKGSRSGKINYREWAHRSSREDKPRTYWSAMIFYPTINPDSRSSADQGVCPEWHLVKQLSPII